MLESDHFSPLTVEIILDPQTFIGPSEQTPGTMAYFTQHHFSPSLTSPRHPTNVPTTVVPPPHVDPPRATAALKNEPGPPSPTKLNVHHPPGHDTFSRFLHAFNSHYGPGEHDVAHPHFDLLETKTCYAVYGELPGLTQKDVAVEANDHLFTLTISGEMKRPTPRVTEGAPAAADPEAVGIAHNESTEPADPAEQTTQVTAEDMEATTAEPSKPSTNQESPKQPQEEGAKPEGKPKPGFHWHITERRVGNFKRVFRFPAELVEMSAVKASIHHGLICIIVPKREDLEAYNKKVEDARKVDIHLDDSKSCSITVVVCWDLST